uniref:Putative secreted protein n=1 Tax=Ixodes ricinus TaxID=34613 RepID=A0A6B0UBZ0_IXORI
MCFFLGGWFGLWYIRFFLFLNWWRIVVFGSLFRRIVIVRIVDLSLKPRQFCFGAICEGVSRNHQSIFIFNGSWLLP